MRSYRKIVNEYINGEDIEGFTIEELEDNPIFMLQVMKQTKDKKMYQMCSNRVKQNYSFVLTLINWFKDDEEFISQVVDNYLELVDNDEDITCIELILRMRKLSIKNHGYDLNVYALKALSFRLKEMITLNEALKSLTPSLREQLGLGFIMIQSDYGSSDIIVNFFASSFLEVIFYEQGKKGLEKIIHQTFNSTSSLIKMGVNNFFINYVRKFDNALADYISCHPELLKEYRDQIEYIYRNWENYNRNDKEEKMNLFIKKIMEYIKDPSITLTEMDVIEFVRRRLSIKELSLDEVSDEFRDDAYASAEEVMKGHVLSLPNYLCLQYALNLAHDIFINGNMEDDDYLTDDKRQGSVYKCPKRFTTLS